MFVLTCKSITNTITVANNNTVLVKGEGAVDVIALDKNVIRLNNVLFVPDLSANLFSVSKATTHGFKTQFCKKECKISKNGEVLISANLIGNIYRVALKPPIQSNENTPIAALASSVDINVWHQRLAHLNFDSIRKLSNGAALGLMLKNSSISPCETCALGKMCRKPYKANPKRAKDLLEIVHTDLCYVSPRSNTKAQYFLTFLDDHSRRATVYYLKTKDEVFDKFVLYKNYVENETGAKIKCIQSDNGREYINQKMLRYLDNCGIKKRLSVPYNP